MFTYGSEAWALSEKTLRKLNGANASCLARFSGKSKVEESRPATCTYSLTRDIRKRRLTWLGHILRMDDHRLVKKAALQQFLAGRTGNLFMDAPKSKTFEQLIELASNRKPWKQLVQIQFSNPPTSTNNNTVTRTRSSTRIKLRAAAATNNKPPTEAEKYRNKDAAAMFFNAAKGTRKPKKTKKKSSGK